MPSLRSTSRYLVLLRDTLRAYLDARAEREKQAWGASLECKRRFTHPDEMKKFRRNAFDDRIAYLEGRVISSDTLAKPKQRGAQ